MNIGPVLDEWQKQAEMELDFRMELKHQMRAHEAAGRSGIDYVVPQPFAELTTKRVMVMEFCEGFKVSDNNMWQQTGASKEQLVTKLCESFAYQILVDGLFNGDPHPGNILVQHDAATGKTRPVLLDWGLVKAFDRTARLSFARMILCISSMNVMGMMDAIEDMGFKLKSDIPVDPELYMSALRLLFKDTDANSGSEAQQNKLKNA
eukprot:Selendium_serpulae@DN2496_c0_g1_i3.p1